ncbi:hypothetical protein Tco_0757368 [Tanacetum coccineum]
MMFDPEEVQQIIIRRMLTLFTRIRDITVKDVERIRKFFNVLDEIDKIVQPLIPEPIHTTPPNDDYVAPATKSILDELLEEFRDEILNVTMVDDEANFNPTKDFEELERLLAKEPQSNFTEIQIGTLYLLEAIQVVYMWWCLDTKQAARKHRKLD